MLFNSFTFIIFLLIVLLIHNLPLKWVFKKGNLLIASYLFYAAWNPPFVLLLWISTIIDWFVAKRIHTAEKQREKQQFVAISLLVNLGFLAFFKYSGFFLDSFVQFISLLGFNYQPPEWNIILPVGISFYTFQTLSYTLDIYRGKAEPWHSFLDYALYVTFFPQLVAGPIVRAVNFLPQLNAEKRTTAQGLGLGLSLLLLGLFQKVVLADALFAPVANLSYGGFNPPDFVAAWVGTFAFAGQIFCDFAGYSNCAIGVALCLGFKLPTNFRFPYAAIGFSDFWRRWHISLSTWLRDYLYIPLGGNRKGYERTQINLMITMLLGGLWHGAAWTFVIWGGLHGLYLIGERWLKQQLGEYAIWKTTGMRFILGMVTFLLVCLAWVFFRAASFGEAFAIVRAMLFLGSGTAVTTLTSFDIRLILLSMSILIGVHWWMRERDLQAVIGSRHWLVRGVAYAMMLALITMMPGESNAFIYFQF